MIFGRKKAASTIEVELKIIGIILGDYLSLGVKIKAPDGCSPQELLRTAQKDGQISRPLYKFLKGFPPGISLLVNGAPFTEDNPSSIRLKNGDQISVFSALSGG